MCFCLFKHIHGTEYVAVDNALLMRVSISKIKNTFPISFQMEFILFLEF